MIVIIPMAGLGSRFSTANYALPKPLIDVNGKTMIERAVESLNIEGEYHFLLRRTEYLDACIEAIHRACPTAQYKIIDTVTEGAAASVLLFKEFINNDDELVVANCDQIMEWDSAKALTDMRQYDGAVVTITSTDPKHSYVAFENNKVSNFAEKEVISDVALTGIHYWRHGKDYVASAEQMISNNDRSRNGEFYVAPTYNYMIRDGKQIGVHMIDESEIHFVGTPTDLEKYLEGR
jgi:NDP-sugar pyrophosphorylase family protein